MHGKIPPQSPHSFIPSSQKTTAADKKSPTVLGVPARQRKHLDEIYSNSREKVESYDFINVHH